MIQCLECKKLGVRRHVEYAEIMFISLKLKTIDKDKPKSKFKPLHQSQIQRSKKDG